MADVGCKLCAADTPAEWVLTYQDGDPGEERARETMLTVGNGYLATRGAAPEAVADAHHYPGTYVAGIYNRLTSVVDGQTREDESIVNLPNWLPVTFRPVRGRWFAPGVWERAHEHTALELRRGVMHREIVVIDDKGRRSRIRQSRLVSMAAPHVAALETRIIPENWSGRIELRFGLDGRVANTNVPTFAGLANQHLNVTETGCDGEHLMWLVAETVNSKLRVAEVARTMIYQGGLEQRADRRTLSEPGFIGQALEVDIGQGEEVVIDKCVAIYTSRDRAIAEPLVAAREEIAYASSFEDLLHAHAAAWNRLWQRFRVELEDRDDMRLPVNVHIFHLLQTLSPHTADLDAGVPAAGLHGESYRGHIFWDELFVLPFLNFRLPELTRALLRYRHRRLPQARRRAAALGMKGALFPWESGSDGREETPRASWNPHAGRWRQDFSSRQYHVNCAIAYNVWQYWQVTGDFGFLASYGAELLFEVARFAASIATYSPADDRYDIRGVMGPDEFHDGYPEQPGWGIDNSAYVNIMTAWTLARALDAHELLGAHRSDQLWQGLQLSESELEKWDHISRRLRLHFFPNGILEQFEGYHELAELDWDDFARRHGDLKKLGMILEAEGDTPNRYQACKQADVLMLLYLFSAEELTELIHRLGYPFDPAIIPEMIDFYMRRTSHGSSLSRIAHSWVLSRTDRSRSWRMLCEALENDIANKQSGSTSEGIHLGAMAGTLDILQRGYTGLDTRHDMLWLNPMVPEELRSLNIDVRYRGQWINLRVNESEVTVRALPGGGHTTSKVVIRDKVYELQPGGTITVPRDE